MLLVGRNPVVLSKLADALTNEGLLVQTTSFVEQASRNFNAAKFDLVAFGRGVDAVTNRQLRADFRAQNPGILFVDGLAPVIPLLTRQISLALSVSVSEENVLTEFGFQQPEILVSVSTSCQLKIDLYQLDEIHTTTQRTLVAESVGAGTHLFVADRMSINEGTIHFLTAEVDNRELVVITL